MRRECCDFGPCTLPTLPAEYESVRRAVHSLERKGLVRLEWRLDDEYPDRPRPYLWVQKIADSLRTSGEV
jgi:hypothetical protein